MSQLTRVTIECNCCGSCNHLKIKASDSAYECYNCHERQWLDANCLDEYMLANSVPFVLAQDDLKNGIPEFAVAEENWP